MNPEFTSAMGGCRRRMLLLVRNIVRDNALAEDIVQDAMLAGLQAENDGKHIDSPEAWLMKVARNKALDMLRSAGYSNTAPLEAAERNAGGQSPEATAGTMDRIRQVKEIAAELPEQQRTAFVLRDILGYRTDEIASVLDCGEDNVRQLISRARKRIRKFLLENE